jgi:phospholipase/carboxylesterase
MTHSEDQLLDGITDLVPALLNCLGIFEQVQANMHPPRFAELAAVISPYSTILQPRLDEFRLLQTSGQAQGIHRLLCQAAQHALNACENFATGAGSANGFGQVMRAMRSHTRALETIYPLAGAMTPISRYFLETPLQGNKALLASFAAESGEAQTGILNADNGRDSRGGFSLYVPEYYRPDQPLPLVVALHGGSGHGADFLWTWLREARGRGFLLLSPTSQQDTWSLMGPDYDSAALTSMVDYIKANWSVNSDSILLTGMSDGATYTLLCGLMPDSPFTHLAALSGVLHSHNFINGNLVRARDKPIYLVHGTLDWMFPVEAAHMARDELLNAGADLVFREIEDLSHTYARPENDAILRWFDPSLALPGQSE